MTDDTHTDGRARTPTFAHWRQADYACRRVPASAIVSVERVAVPRTLTSGAFNEVMRYMDDHGTPWPGAPSAVRGASADQRSNAPCRCCCRTPEQQAVIDDWARRALTSNDRHVDVTFRHAARPTAPRYRMGIWTPRY